MEWKGNLLLFLSLCLLVYLSQQKYLLHRVHGLPRCASRTFGNATIVLLNPLHRIRTSAEKLVCGSPVTHVGLVWVDARGTPFLLHTERASGVRLEPLRPWLAHTLRQKHQVFIRRPSGTRVDGVVLESVIMPYLNVRYSFGFWKAVLQTWWPALEMPRASRPFDRFCSELVAEVLGQVGVLAFNEEFVPRLVLPSDFWDTHRLSFVPNVRLSPVEEVVTERYA